MEQLIKTLGFDKGSSLVHIEETMLNVRDFSPEYYMIRRIDSSLQLWEVAVVVHDYIKNNM